MYRFHKIYRFFRKAIAPLNISSTFRLFRPIFLTCYQIQGKKQGYKILYHRNSIEIILSNQKMRLSDGQWVYVPELLSNWGRFFGAIYPEFDGTYDVVDYSKSMRHKLIKANTTFLIPGLCESYDSSDVYFQDYQPKDGDIVFDCGAYCGIVTYRLSKLVGNKGRVFAFEPDEKNFDALCTNIQMHKLKNVTPLNMGLYSRSTKLRFNTEGNPGSAFTDTALRDRRSTMVEVMSLEDAYRGLELTKLNFIKMDIEGAEIPVIEGSTDFIQRSNLRFSIASYHVVDGIPTYLRLAKIFPKLGYKIITHNQDEGSYVYDCNTYAYK